MEWIESSGVEKEIILCLGKKTKTYNDISNETNNSFRTIHKTIERMENKGLVERSKDYGKDSRSWKINIIKDKVNVKRLSNFYLTFFIISTFFYMILLFYNIYYGNLRILVFETLYFIITTGYMLINSISDDDRVVVYKLVDTGQ